MNQQSSETRTYRKSRTAMEIEHAVGVVLNELLTRYVAQGQTRASVITDLRTGTIRALAMISGLDPDAEEARQLYAEGLAEDMGYDLEGGPWWAECLLPMAPHAGQEGASEELAEDEGETA